MFIQGLNIGNDVLEDSLLGYVDVQVYYVCFCQLKLFTFLCLLLLVVCFVSFEVDCHSYLFRVLILCVAKNHRIYDKTHLIQHYTFSLALQKCGLIVRYRLYIVYRYLHQNLCIQFRKQSFATHGESQISTICSLQLYTSTNSQQWDPCFL